MEPPPVLQNPHSVASASPISTWRHVDVDVPCAQGREELNVCGRFGRLTPRCVVWSWVSFRYVKLLQRYTQAKKFPNAPTYRYSYTVR